MTPLWMVNLRYMGQNLENNGHLDSGQIIITNYCNYDYRYVQTNIEGFRVAAVTYRDLPRPFQSPLCSI